jgi:hypothetical protein
LIEIASHFGVFDGREWFCGDIPTKTAGVTAQMAAATNVSFLQPFKFLPIWSRMIRPTVFLIQGLQSMP